MTMPFERARALRWAGEFLEKLSIMDGLAFPEDIKREISAILRHYPSASSIANEAKFQSLVAAHPAKGSRHQLWLAPEQHPEEPS